MAWLSGKKTYIVSVLMVLTGLLDVLTTDLSFNGIMGFLASDQVQLMLNGFGFSFLRMGVAKK